MYYYNRKPPLWQKLKSAWGVWRGSPAPHFDDPNLYLFAQNFLGLSSSATDQLMLRPYSQPRYRYRHLSKPKKDGSLRELQEPESELKSLQYKILRQVLSLHPPHPAAIGFRLGKSTADHAWTHAGAATIITTDLEDFFPNTHRRRIKDWFVNFGAYTDTTADFLTILCTYQGGLPQGAPTSPMLSNLVNTELDERLENRAKQSGGNYSRYGDDLAFSWPDSHEPPSDFEAGVRGVLHEYGYRINPKKGWAVFSRADEPQITGIVLKQNGDIDLPDSLRKTMKMLQKGQSNAEKRRYQGYVAYQNMLKRR